MRKSRRGGIYFQNGLNLFHVAAKSVKNLEVGIGGKTKVRGILAC